MDRIETKQFFDGDRRVTDRVALSRPCKVFDPMMGKYIAGQTTDVSDGGLLLVAERPLLAKPGDTVYVGVAMTRRQTLLQADQMREAEVVRVLSTTDGRNAVAVRFFDAARPAIQQLAA